MRSLNKIALFVGLVAMVGCGDDPEQSLNGVFPSSGFIGRKLRVEVSGDNASFVDGQVSLDFGAGVTVEKVAVASPTALFADITIADTAALGLRDVVVNQGGAALTLREAFQLESPVAFTTQGTVAQGSVVSFTARNLDFYAPFDATCGAAVFGICLQYTGMQVKVPTGMNAVLNAVDAFTVTGTLYIDLDAQSGAISFTSGPAGDATKQVVSAVGADTEVATRAPVALAAGTPTTTTVAAPFDSHLYEFTAAATSAARFSASPGDPNADPTIYVLPESGRFTEMVAATAAPNALSASGGKYFAIYSDGTGLADYSYAIRVNPVALTALAEADTAGANDLLANAQNAGANASILLMGATISSETDADWVRFTVPANSAAKKVHVVTAGGDPLTDTYVEIYKNSEATMIGESADSGYHEDTLSTAIGGDATVIFVKIYGSPGYFQPSHSQYVAAIWLE
jgi:hypothetical protein